MDLRRPQLVSQSLYDLVRRCSACVTDWTRWSPSTFFELGVRLAISPWASVQVLDEEWADTQASDHESPQLTQHETMRELFQPIGYRGKKDDRIGALLARSLVSMRETAGVDGGHFVRPVVLDSLSRVQEARADVSKSLVDEADALHHSEQRRRNTTQALFAEIREIKVEQEDAALQRRIAAWLYLEHRVSAGSLARGDPRHELWRALGNAVVEALYASDADGDLELAEVIEGRLPSD